MKMFINVFNSFQINNIFYHIYVQIDMNRNFQNGAANKIQ